MAGGESNPATVPPPVDYSAAMMYASDNSTTVAMGQIAAQRFAMEQASMDRQMQMSVNLELGIERLDTKLQIAKLNYIQTMTEESDRHEEKMAEIGADVDAARAEQAAADAPELQDVSDFLNDS